MIDMNSMEAVLKAEQVKRVAELAKEIWYEHYVPIIGKEQVDYMVERFQSEAAITEQLNHGGYEYYLMKEQSGYYGYLSFCQEEKALFLSKFYITKPFRGKGYARMALEWLEEIGRKKGLTKIWLRVNRDNQNSIHAYERLGFVKSGEKVADIGGGYVMDDYLMEKLI